MKPEHQILLYDYYGLRIYLLHTDPVPVHIYASFQDRCAMARIVFYNGIHQKNSLESVAGNELLLQEDIDNFLFILDANLPYILKSWQDHFVYALPVKPEIIKTKLR